MHGATALPCLEIGNLTIDPPIIQGGMGVRVSASRLASAVSNEGCLGVVAAVGTGEEWPDRSVDYPTRSYLSLRALLRETRALTSRPFGVNIMCALTNYESLVRASVEEDVSVILSGAGLPLKLPGLVGSSPVKLIPIVSSGRAAELICRTWGRKYKRLPDALVVEGPLAGGHLGFAMDEVGKRAHRGALEEIVTDVIAVAAAVAQETGTRIPVIAAGGVFDGYDIARFLRLGASGVQMATRFVCTDECDAAHAYKQAYLDCSQEDIIIVKSPLGMPLRVIRNDFVDRVIQGQKTPFKCLYRCLLPCNPAESNYCIADALVNAYRGNMKQGFAICGSNAYRITKIVPVRELVGELVQEAVAGLAASQQTV